MNQKRIARAPEGPKWSPLGRARGWKLGKECIKTRYRMAGGAERGPQRGAGGYNAVSGANVVAFLPPAAHLLINKKCMAGWSIEGEHTIAAANGLKMKRFIDESYLDPAFTPGLC